MDDPDQGNIHSASDYGVAASHPGFTVQPMLVAPTTAAEANTLSLDLIPVACLSLYDVLFEFDSSFPLPAAQNVLQELPGLRESHKNASGQLPPVSIFGHADPVGGDVYNKPLSGRRARSIYGLLTHDLGLWGDLYNEEWNSKNVIATMRQATGLPGGTTRSDLMQAYMTLLFPAKLEKTDFLGQGKNSSGKADFQGCSIFNPLIVLSDDDNKNLPHSRRNEENQPNRRVVLFLFRPNVNPDPQLWPCPGATDPSIEACKQRFFGPPKTGAERSKPGSERREFAKTKDTFACRFYYRIARLSPCESPGELKTIRIRLFDPFTVKVSEAPYQVTADGKVFKTKADPEGFLTFSLASIPKECLVEWGATEDESGFLYSMKIYLNLDGLSEEDEVERRLHNLGYFYGETLADNVRAFQTDFGLAPSGNPADVKTTLRDWHNDPIQIQARPDQASPGGADETS